VAVSNAVRDTLVQHFEVPEHLTAVVNGFVPVADFASEEKRSRRQRVIRELGWSENTFVVGGCGSLGWRKGTDVFLQIAHAVRASGDCERVRFLWLGGEAAGDPALEFAHDVRALGLQGVCQRVSANANVLDYYCSMDVFALTSREDPFPLVMLEAGSLGIPIVCFEGSGGAQEFLGDDAGLIAPYLNVAAFAGHLTRLRKEPALCENFASTASRKVRSCYTIETQAPTLLNIIEHCMLDSDSGGH
jgi:glycosyltransferase involved in cell wall biosynthesis